MIRLEKESAVLRDLERGIAELTIDDDVWVVSFDLGRRAHAKGISVPATLILIAVCTSSWRVDRGLRFRFLHAELAED
jgi:hypothetical protein